MKLFEPEDFNDVGMWAPISSMDMNHAANIANAKTADLVAESKRLRIENQKLRDECVILRTALTEALDWICPHTEAAEQFKKTGPRVWCIECSQYLRSEADATVSTRLSEVLAKCKELDG